MMTNVYKKIWQLLSMSNNTNKDKPFYFQATTKFSECKTVHHKCAYICSCCNFYYYPVWPLNGCYCCGEDLTDDSCFCNHILCCWFPTCLGCCSMGMLSLCGVDAQYTMNKKMEEACVRMENRNFGSTWQPDYIVTPNQYLRDEADPLPLRIDENRVKELCEIALNP